jgi:hypothetical protein
LTTPHSLPPDVVEALKLGRPVEAIKRLRKASGMGLAEAKALVDAFSRGKTAYQPPASKPRERREGTPRRNEMPATVHPHQYVAHQQPAVSRAGLGQGEVPRSNSAFWWVVFLVVVALVGYFVLER